jgi:hypothetical protein
LILRPLSTTFRRMNTVTRPTRILWPNVLTVVSAAILIGAEVFGAAFAAGWAVATLWQLPALFEEVLQGIFCLGGVAVMIAFIRAAKRVEPFTK